jgi:aminomethyltransferase
MSDAIRLPLHDRHAAAGARFAPFAGHEMPMWYSGILDEHHAVRQAAGLFDVSHMGEVFVRGPRATEAVDLLVTNRCGALAVGRALYTVMCRPDGTIVDDLIVTRLGEQEWLICVNAANRAKDFSWITGQVGALATVTDESDQWAQLALQGPRAVDIAAAVAGDDVRTVPPFSVCWSKMAGVRVLLSRTGYTGEDGFEIYIPREQATPVFDALVAAGTPLGLKLAGLGCRDTLRLEARLALYGQDIDDSTSPVEAGLGWVVGWDKPSFIGREALLSQRAEGAKRLLRGFVLSEKGVMRHGYPIFDGDVRVGEITSGSVAPSLGGVSIGLGYVDAAFADRESLLIGVRDRRIPATVAKKPFYKRSS